MLKSDLRDLLIQLAIMGELSAKEMNVIANTTDEGERHYLLQVMASRIVGGKCDPAYEKVLKDYQSANIQFSTIIDEDYPPSLKEIHSPPVVLFYKGDWKLTKRRRLAIVGSRRASAYGEQVLAVLLPALVAKNVTIVSGLAAGIDQYAHQQTIRLKGDTIAVIGTGLDVYYPSQNQHLQQHMLDKQLVISEYPLGKKPHRSHFPMRNRIIAGLCQGTLVVEAKERSGSLITANLALQENREVFAVPGSILTTASSGTNHLIRAGAKLVMTADDILEEMTHLWQL